VIIAKEQHRQQYQYFDRNTSVAQGEGADSRNIFPRPAKRGKNPVDDSDEFEDPITRQVIVGPVVASDGCTHDRCCKLLDLSYASCC